MITELSLWIRCTRKPNDSQYLHDEQTIELESDREKKSKKRKRIIIDVAITLAVIGVAILLGAVLGKVILDNII